jgi:hypothetical protein
MYAGLAKPVMKHISEFYPVSLVNSENRKEVGFLYGDRMGMMMNRDDESPNGYKSCGS